MIEFVGGCITGVVALIGYGAYRATNSDGWDNSNVLNWLRLLSHCFMHPEDFGHMYYIDSGTEDFLIDANRLHLLDKPFGYINKDEFSENFPESRP